MKKSTKIKEAEVKSEIVLNESDIEKFDPTVSELAAMVANSKQITVEDLKDKAMIEKVHETRIEFKNKRIAIEKYGKSLRDVATAFNRKVSAREDELIAIIEPEEKRLAQIEEEAKELAIIESRREKLPVRRERLSLIGDEVEVSDDELIKMDANQFETYINKRISDKLNKDKIALEEETKAKEAARQKEQKEAQDKIDAERAELEAEKKKLQEDKERHDKEVRERQEQEKRDKEKRDADLKRANEETEAKAREKERIERKIQELED